MEARGKNGHIQLVEENPYRFPAPKQPGSDAGWAAKEELCRESAFEKAVDADGQTGEKAAFGELPMRKSAPGDRPVIVGAGPAGLFCGYMLAKAGVVLDEYIKEYHLDALTLRCWNEMETYLRVCPCVLLSELNDRGIVASCEIDMCSALTMRAMNLASEQPTAVLDWNNNYGDDENKVILFHCGPVAQG